MKTRVKVRGYQGTAEVLSQTRGTVTVEFDNGRIVTVPTDETFVSEVIPATEPAASSKQEDDSDG